MRGGCVPRRMQRRLQVHSFLNCQCMPNTSLPRRCKTPPSIYRGLLHAAAQSQPEVRGALDPDLLDLDSAYTAQRGEALGPKGTSFRLRFGMPIMAQVLATVHHLLTD